MRGLLGIIALAAACVSTHHAPDSGVASDTCDHTDPGSICCTSQAGCPTQPFQACAPPGTPLGCGVCNMDPGTCTTDAECKANDATTICEPVTCACDPVPARTCVPGCTVTTRCAEGEACATTTGRCEPTRCVHDPDCPADFSCSGGSCERNACTDASQCAGFCVEGKCYSQAGECRGPVA